MVRTGRQPGSANRSASASMVALRRWSATASAPSAGSAWSAVPPPSRSSDTTCMLPSVRVPVLSQQITSTLASPSIAGRSWTSTRRDASLTTPTAMATLVSSTSPSGTMPLSPATEPRSASAVVWPRRNWVTSNSGPTMTSSQLIQVSTRLIASLISDRAGEYPRACLVSFAA